MSACCRLAAAFLVAAFSSMAPCARAQDDKQPSDPKEIQPPAPQQPPSLDNAWATFEYFFAAADRKDWDDAARCLDFSKVSEDINKGNVAYQLKEILDRIAVVKKAEVLEHEGNDPYFFPSDKRLIAIELVDDTWMFSAGTVAGIDDLYEKYKGSPRVAGLDWLAGLFAGISPELTRTGFLLPHYQWICLLLLIFVGFLVDLLTRAILIRASRAWFKYVRGDADQKVDKRVWKPIGLLAQALIWYAGTQLIGLPPQVTKIVLVGLKFFAVVAAVWTFFRLIDLLVAFLAGKASKTDTRFDDLLVPLLSRSLKVFVIVVGTLVCAEAFDLPIAGLLGGLGIGGVAIGFASKDAISNLFGSITVLTDRPFEIGDWVVTEGIEGSVESVGFRSTRIRTFYNSLVTLPNSRLTTAAVDNMGKRRYRRIKTMIGVEYSTTPEQIDAFCEGIRELIRLHPYTRKDYYHVYFNEFSDSSLNILLYCFLECPEWSTELREKHRLYVDIMKLAKKLGVGFAFPTRTLHLFQEEQSAERSSPDLPNPAQAGRQLAGSIAGPLLTGDERPGAVEF